MRLRPLLVGEANPYQTDPRLAQRFALYPDPPRCAGWNLCHRVMGLSEDEYLRRFDRVNLCNGKWSMREARAAAVDIQVETVNGKHGKLVLFGSKVCKAFGVAFEPFTMFQGFVVLPHPSGLSRTWNEPGAFERARAVLAEAEII